MEIIRKEGVMITEVKELNIETTKGNGVAFYACVRDGKVYSLDQLCSHPSKEELERYILFLQKVHLAIERTSGPSNSIGRPYSVDFKP